MKKVAFAFALMVTVFSCDNSKDNSQETGTVANNQASAPLSNEVPRGGEEPNIAEMADKPLSKSAEKFKGEYQLQDNDEVKTLIREHPQKPGLLAVTTYVGSFDPQTINFWYNENNDMISSKEFKGQGKYTTIQLDPSGETIINIHHDWNKNRTDTTVYKRIK